jgi:transposase InsO family protein
MPWKVSSPVSERLEFVCLAAQEQANLRQLCRRFGISPTTGYKWKQRFQLQGAAGLQEQSRRPHHSPARSGPVVEQAVLELRQQHPKWGGRKLRARLLSLGHLEVPAASTITAILARHHLLDPQEAAKHRRFHRFEHPQANDLWQMDFKGDFALGRARCHPLTVLDDHSRFNLGLVACSDQTTQRTQTALTAIFRRYGLPWRMTMDNGKPWAAFTNGRSCHTHFSAWLIRLGITVSHSRPYHPQTQGKDERFHRTLKLELLSDQRWSDFAQCQQAFDRWRESYNLVRPHEALKLAVPASRYEPSPRAFPERLPAIEYGEGEVVRKVGERGQVKYQQRKFFVGDAFGGLYVALRPTTIDGLLEVYFCQQKVGSIDLKAVGSKKQEVSTMSPNTCP